MTTPEIPNKFQNGKIYTLRSPQTELFYIGSTCSPLHKRLYEHKGDYKRHLEDKFNYLSSFEITKYPDCFVELLESFPCQDRNELRKREGELIRLHRKSTVNYRVECRTDKEYREDTKEERKEYEKQYREKNKDKLEEKHRKYYLENMDTIKEKHAVYRDENRQLLKERSIIFRGKNKDKISKEHKAYYEKNKERIHEKKTCECGGKFTHQHFSTHKKSLKHINYITALEAI
jgi:hypothetical protein